MAMSCGFRPRRPSSQPPEIITVPARLADPPGRGYIPRMRFPVSCATLCVVAACLVSGCRTPSGATSPTVRLDRRALAGTFVGEANGPPRGQVIWAIRTLWRLTVDDKGKIQGEIRREQQLHTGFEGALPCNHKPWALTTRRARIRAGRLIGTREARLELDTPSAKGHLACAVVLPWSARCRIHALPGGRLVAQCGEIRELLRRVSLTGVWEWSEQRTDRAGDTRIWSQRYHLWQKGRAIQGVLDDIQVVKSNDGQRYRCNGRLMRTQQFRQRLVGLLKGLDVEVTLRDRIQQRSLCPGEEPPGPTLQGTWDPLKETVVLEADNTSRTFRRLPGARPAIEPKGR